ncbi:LLM class flavin-dependent oxidoreductase [Chitinimonas sp.]|uniref:LLM class flavin-dependent oxidoreductase n=1 Tax=Chitinimonas sp. TaxID=1934313 RepID=UPI002F95714F
MARPIRFNAFAMNTVGHQSPGLWRHPEDESWRYADLRFWTELALTLEAGCFDALFLADVLGVYDVYQGSADAALRHAVQVPTNDPLLLVPAMAAATTDLGFGVTFSLSYEHPYPFARRMSTLDHLTRGRVGWNIVTGYLDSAARNLGLSQQGAHDARYDYAEEYLEVVYKLWEASWEDGAVRRDRQGRVYTDPSRVHPIAHAGEHFRVPGIHLCEPSPQRTPLLYQAGTSPRGRAFAGKHAEAVFISAPSRAILKKQVDGIRSAAVAAGRRADEIRIYGQALIVTASTEAEAQRKFADYREHVDVEAALALLSGWTGIDFAGYGHGDPIRHIENDAGRTALASFTTDDPSRLWTVGEAARFVGLGGRGPVLVGDPGQVADQLEGWLDETGIDGFNLAFAITPGTFRDVVELVVPELQKRGRYATSYTAGTLRHKLLGQGDHLPPHHPGRQFHAAHPATATPSKEPA